MRKIYSLLVWTLMISVHVFGQGSGLSKADYPTPVPPSPEAAALGRYGDIPVSLYSGQPNISVPVYEFKNGDINVNTSLNYNSGGIRVDDIATNVGLGWSLSAGGVITRTVRGTPDESTSGSELPVNFNPNMASGTVSGGLSADYNTALQSVLDNRDYERDMYYFNFLNFSGKFIISRAGKVCFLPANQNLKVRPFNGQSYNSGFIITDDKGYQYYFSDAEGSSATSVCSIGAEGPNELSGYHTSAWYLSKIVSPNNYQVFFSYESQGYTIPTSSHQVKYINANAASCGELSSLNRDCQRVETFTGIRLKRIFSNDNHMEMDFNYSAASRLDLDYNNTHQGNYLESIALILQGNTGSAIRNIRSWNFGYGYFTPSTTPRLKLLSFKEDSKPAYQFTYNETSVLPPRLSTTQDHWGFANAGGASMPPLPGSGDSGNYREPDFNQTKAASLISIKYPTGGHTDFEYEPHTNTITKTGTSYTDGGVTVSVEPNVGNEVTESTFTVPLGAINLSFSAFLQTVNFDDQIRGTLFDGTTNAIIYSKTSDFFGPVNTNSAVLRLRLERFNLIDRGSVSVSWKVPTTTTTTEVGIVYGGLRIKTIKSYDADNHLAGSKFYSYNWLNDPTKSSATAPDGSIKNYYSSYSVPSGNPSIGSCSYYVFSSYTVQPLDNGSDQSFGYGQVVETDVADGSNGRNVYTYDPATAGQEPASPQGQSWTSGLLLIKAEQKYDINMGTYKDVRKTKSFYQGILAGSFISDPSTWAPNEIVIPNWKIAFSRPQIGDVTAEFLVEKYFTLSHMVQLKKIEETIYNADGVTPVTQSTDYTYNNPVYNFPTSAAVIDSHGKTIYTETKYVPDLASAAGSPAVYTSMNNANIISPVVEQTITNQTDNVQLSYKKTNYLDWGNAIYKPVSVQTSYYGGQLTTELSFDRYDSMGNILMFTPRSGPSVTYLWGYNKRYPIAEIKNASYTVVESVLGAENIESMSNQTVPDKGQIDTFLQPLFNSTGLSGAQITKYVSDPVFGLTSSTDIKGNTSYYVYDSFQRLTDIKDQYGRIVKHIDYHYAQ